MIFIRKGYGGCFYWAIKGNFEETKRKKERGREKEEKEEKNTKRDFPGGPVIETVLSLQRAWVQSLVMELRSCALLRMTKTKTNKQTNKKQGKKERK